MDESLKILIIMVSVVAIVVGIIAAGITVDKARDNRILLEMRENKTIIIVNGESINPEDIKSMSEGNRLVIETKSGKTIKSSNYTIITPKPPVKVEK